MLHYKLWLLFTAENLLIAKLTSAFSVYSIGFISVLFWFPIIDSVFKMHNPIKLQSFVKTKSLYH